VNETLLYLLATASLLFGGPAAGVPYDPDRTFQFAGPCSQQQHIGVPGVVSVRACDKLAHALSGSGLTVLSFALDRRAGKESCVRTALRAALRVQVASAAFELGVALTERSRWGRVGYGIGLRDHLAVTLGSAVAGAGLCGARAALQ